MISFLVKFGFYLQRQGAIKGPMTFILVHGRHRLAAGVVLVLCIENVIDIRLAKCVRFILSRVS